MSFGNSGGSVSRFPRVLFFTAGMLATEEEENAASKFFPNVSLRNAQMVASMPSSALEECDAVAGLVPARYAAVYPDVSDFEGGRLLRMSDYDRPHGAITDPNNEAARAAKPPSRGEVIGANQGALRGAGSITQLDGGFVAPSPANPPNPHGLPDAGVTALPIGVSDADRVGLTTEARPGVFAPPTPAADEEVEAPGDGVP